MLWSELSRSLPPAQPADDLEARWLAAAESLGKVLVLDDDPTGVQTVHGVPVYTSWEEPVLRAALLDSSRTVYVLTNSRALSADRSARLHRELARNLLRAAAATSGVFFLVSRGDSTLRGHYPLETGILNEELGGFDGEIIAPCFFEGGRITYHDVHYLRENDRLTPVGGTEYARDPDFGYRSSDLKDWVAEKTRGAFPANRVVSIPLEILRRGDAGRVAALLGGLSNFGKAIVNAVDYSDLKVFLIGLAEAKARGKRFLCRTAASFVRVAGGIEPRSLLSAEDLHTGGAPGLIIVGSYTARTTAQMRRLADFPNLAWIEWHISEATDETRMEAEAARAAAEIDRAMAAGWNACLYTSREFQNPGDHLAFAARISAGLVRTLAALESAPGFLLAKGGITASEIGLKGLGVRRALVMGQILAGVPVWQLGKESRFPGMPYVIFPGNVGDEEAMLDVMNVLTESHSKRKGN